MVISRLATLSIFLALVFSHIRADVSAGEEGGGIAVDTARSNAPDSSADLKIELGKLKSKIQALESHIDEKTQEAKKKDDTISLKEKVISDKSDNILSLESEILSLKRKEKLDAEEQVGKAHARADELEMEVGELKGKLEIQEKEKEGLEAQTKEAEKKTSDFNLRLEILQKLNDEQKTRIQKTEHALRVAEEEIIKVKFEATSKVKELMEVHGAWLPPWLASHFFHIRSLAESLWNEHGKPAMDLVIQKGLERKAHAEKWAEPHVGTIKTKWIPAVKEQWLVVKKNAEPHLQSVTMKTVEIYESSKNAITPQIIKVQEVVDPYFQEARKVSKPYINQVATAAKPHLDKVQVLLKPYTTELVHAYGKFLESATTNHRKVEANVREVLNRHELTRPLASKELEWFAACALLAVPIIILFNFSSAIFGRKTQKPARHAHSHHARRKAKRGHSDK